MPPKARSYDPSKIRTALRAQVAAVSAVAHRLDAEQRALPCGLPGWDVHHLLVHIAGGIDAIPKLLAEPEPAPPARTDLSAWAVSTARPADQLDAGARADAVAATDAAAAIDAATARLEAVLDEAVRPRRLIPHAFGVMRSTDFLVTRLVELVVHSVDLAAATGVDVPLDRQAVATVVRLLADALAARKAPGNAVELRVPPYAAVQCVAGPRHTRGTPPGVVETDPLTWIRLATGRATWAEALEAARLTASGERADLSPYLPVLG